MGQFFKSMEIHKIQNSTALTDYGMKRITECDIFPGYFLPYGVCFDGLRNACRITECSGITEWKDYGMMIRVFGSGSVQFLVW